MSQLFILPLFISFIAESSIYIYLNSVSSSIDPNKEILIVYHSEISSNKKKKEKCNDFTTISFTCFSYMMVSA